MGRREERRLVLSERQKQTFTHHSPGPIATPSFFPWNYSKGQTGNKFPDKSQEKNIPSVSDPLPPRSLSQELL